MNIVQTNLAEFNLTLQRYIEVSGKTPQLAVLKQGSKLGYALSNRLGNLKPARGNITSERLSALREGQGVFVRESVRNKVFAREKVATVLDPNRDRYTGGNSRLRFVRGKGKNQKFLGSLNRKGKRLNFQALAVKAELGLRERGIGYLGLATRVRGIDKIPPGKLERWFGRYRQELAQAGLAVSTAGASLEMRFGGEGVDVGDALHKPRQQRLIAESLREVNDDMRVYLSDQLQKNKLKAGLSR